MDTETHPQEGNSVPLRAWNHCNCVRVEIDSAVVDGCQSVILPQVTFGIAVRMAVMSIVAGNDAK